MFRNCFTLTAVCVAIVLSSFSYAGNPNPQPVIAPAPHCQVPCGIYTDQLRFEMMLEDTKTIAKSIDQINDFAASVGQGAMTGNAVNQATRWVTTKEDHATKIQDVMAAYFFAQRIKSDHADYTGQLASAHRVIVAAMKCKQSADSATAVALKASILEFYKAYEGKEPEFESHE